MATPAAIPSVREQADEGVVRRERIPRWVGVVLPVAILGGVGMVALYAVNRSWLPFVLFLAGSAALGLLTGFAARRSLPHRSNMLRWAVAMGALTVGLLAAGVVAALACDRAGPNELGIYLSSHDPRHTANSRQARCSPFS